MRVPGNLEAQNHLDAENKIRQAQNRPSVEKELIMLMDEMEMREMLANGKTIQMPQEKLE